MSVFIGNECILTLYILQVRWADVEEKKEQIKMRDIGFVVGQDWKRVMDPTDGASALARTKIIPNRFQN